MTVHPGSRPVKEGSQEELPDYLQGFDPETLVPIEKREYERLKNNRRYLLDQLTSAKAKLEKNTDKLKNGYTLSFLEKAALFIERTEGVPPPPTPAEMPANPYEISLRRILKNLLQKS